MLAEMETWIGGEFRRKVWVRPGAGAGLGVVLDGEIYLQRMEAGELFVEAAPGWDWVFVSNLDGEARHYDFTCNEAYAGYLVEEIVGRFSPAGSGGHLVAGLSLSGLAAAHAALRYPETFSYALCQSGSFWWERERLAAQVSAGSTRFWLSVGDREDGAGDVHAPTGLRQEVGQRVAVEGMAGALARAGYPVRCEVFEGGHELGPWRAEIPRAVRWLISGEGDVTL